MRVITGSQVPQVMAFSPNGRLLAVESAAGTVHLWDVATGELEGAFYNIPVSDNGASQILFNPNGKSLVVASGGVVTIWDLTTKKQTAEFAGDNNGDIVAVEFTPAGRLLAFEDNTSQNAGIVWDVTNDTQVSTVDLAFLPMPWCMAMFGPRGKQALLWTPLLGEVYLVDIATGKMINAVAVPISFPVEVALSPDGSHIAAVSPVVGTVAVWRAENH